MSSTDPPKRVIFGFTLQQLIVIVIGLAVLTSFYFSYRNTERMVQNLDEKLGTINSKLDGLKETH